MKDEDIKLLVDEVLSTFATNDAFGFVKEGVVHLVGEVNSERERIDIVETVRGVPGVRAVRDELRIEFVPPGGSHVVPHPEKPVEMAEEGGDIAVEGTEYDLNDPVGTTDVMEASAEAEPFFPPTDRVVRTVAETEEGYEVVGGFAPTSMDDPAPGEWPVSGVRRGDEEIADDVRRELGEDAATTDLHEVRVWVRDGVVYLRGRVGSLVDAEAAEEVAARVPGVEEVREELEVSG